MNNREREEFHWRDCSPEGLEKIHKKQKLEREKWWRQWLRQVRKKPFSCCPCTPAEEEIRKEQELEKEERIVEARKAYKEQDNSLESWFCERRPPPPPITSWPANIDFSKVSDPDYKPEIILETLADYERAMEWDAFKRGRTIYRRKNDYCYY